MIHTDGKPTISTRPLPKVSPALGAYLKAMQELKEAEEEQTFPESLYTAWEIIDGK